MKYAINVRMKNSGPAKYLVESVPSNDLNEAFSLASTLADKAGEGHFVEIIENYSNESVANFNKE